MAKREHIAELKKGYPSWNSWRRANPGVTPDLAEADLTQMDLSRLDLGQADLRATSLRHADLCGANLRRADLRNADLWGAYLTQANMTLANLCQANLSQADLSEAKLKDANLNEADLSEARLFWTDLSRADLSETDLRDTFMNQVVSREACFDDANLLRFRAAGCDFAGVRCQRADFSDYDEEEPNWRELGEGEFEKLYGPLFGVEVLLDPRVEFAIAAELMVWLKNRWQTMRPEVELAFDELRRQPQGYVGQFRAPRDAVATVRDCFAEQLRTLFANQGRTEGETDILVDQNLEGLDRRLVRASIPAAQLLVEKIGLTAIQGDKREPTVIEYYEAGAMKIGSVQGENVVIAEKLLGTGMLNLVQAAQDEASVTAAVEQQMRQWNAAAEENREEIVDEFAAAIPKDKLAFWKSTLASLVANGATAGVGVLAQQILSHLAK